MINRLVKIADSLDRRGFIEEANQIDSIIIRESEVISETIVRDHLKDIEDADLDYPIFITENLEIVDGAHRALKAEQLGQKIKAIELTKEDFNRVLMPDTYYGQVYVDDNDVYYSVDAIQKLYGNRDWKLYDPKEILKRSGDFWGEETGIVLDKLNIKLD